MKTKSRSIAVIPLMIVGLLAAAPACFAKGWVALQDLTASGYQTAFTRWTSTPYGLRLTCVTGYDSGAGPRFAAIWTEQSGPGYYAAHLMTAAQFNTANTSHQAQGFQPVFISAFTSSGIHYYNAIWEYQPNPPVTVEVELSRSALTAEILAKAAQGYTFNYVTTFTDNGTDLYAAIWVKDQTGTQCSYGRTGAQYQSDFNTQTRLGYRLIAVSTSMSGTTPLFSAVWRRPFGDAWYNYAGISGANYAGETLNAYYTGFRPTFVSAYPNSGVASLNATWTYNGGMDPAAAQPIYTAVNDYMRTNHVPGISLAIARNGRLVFAKGFGLADQGADVWVHPDHRFRIASVSKVFTVAAVLRLRDGYGGSLSSLDGKVFGSGAFLDSTYGTPPYGAWETQMTLRRLLNHTSGWTDDGQLWNNAYGTDHAAIISWQLDNNHPTYQPGTFYEYHNIDFCVAGRVIEQLSGLTYEKYVQTQVQAPCGISDMELGNQTLLGRKPGEVVYYQAPQSGDPYVTIDPHRMDANGGWIARPIDLLLFLRRIDGLPTQADIISSNRFMEMQTGSTPNPGYGLATILGNTWWGHNGCMDGTIAFLVHRNDGFDFAVVCNIRPDNDDCAWNLRNAVDAAINAVPANAWPDDDLFPSVNLSYDAWTAATFPDFLRVQPGMKAGFWGATGDLDADGIPNLLEAYFQLDPFQANVLPYKAVLEGADFVVRWTRGSLASFNGVQLQPQYKTNINSPSWLSGPGIQTSAGSRGSPSNYETHFPISSSPMVFERLQVTAP